MVETLTEQLPGGETGQQAEELIKKGWHGLKSSKLPQVREALGENYYRGSDLDFKIGEVRYFIAPGQHINSLSLSRQEPGGVSEELELQTAGQNNPSLIRYCRFSPRDSTGQTAEKPKIEIQNTPAALEHARNFIERFEADLNPR